jgi:hypothetical protein
MSLTGPSCDSLCRFADDIPCLGTTADEAADEALARSAATGLRPRHPRTPTKAALANGSGVNGHANGLAMGSSPRSKPASPWYADRAASRNAGKTASDRAGSAAAEPSGSGRSPGRRSSAAAAQTPAAQPAAEPVAPRRKQIRAKQSRRRRSPGASQPAAAAAAAAAEAVGEAAPREPAVVATQSGGPAKRTRRAAAGAGDCGDSDHSSGGGGGGGGSDSSGKVQPRCADAAGSRPGRSRISAAGTGSRSKPQGRPLAEVRADFLAGLSAKELQRWSTVGGAGVERGVRAWVGEPFALGFHLSTCCGRHCVRLCTWYLL